MKSDIVTFNVWGKNSREGAYTDLINEMRRPQTHVINLQEAAKWIDVLRGVSRPLSDTGLKWTVLAAPTNYPRGAHNNVILYREDVLALVRVRWHDMPNPQVDMDRWVIEARFRYRKLHREFLDVNTHLHPHIENPDWWRLPRQAEAREHIQWLQARVRRSNPDIPVVVAADWNINLRSRVGRLSKFFPTKVFAAVRMRHNWDIAGWSTMGTHGRRVIDAMFVRQRWWFRVKKNEVVRKNSDHNLVRMTVEVTPR